MTNLFIPSDKIHASFVSKNGASKAQSFTLSHVIYKDNIKIMHGLEVKIVKGQVFITYVVVEHTNTGGSIDSEVLYEEKVDTPASFNTMDMLDLANKCYNKYLSQK